eukprot:gene1400-biopygen19812
MPELGGGAAGSRRLRSSYMLFGRLMLVTTRREPARSGWSSGWNSRERLEYPPGAVGIPARGGWNPQRAGAVGIPAGCGWNIRRERLKYPPGAVGIPAGSGWNTRQEQIRYPLGMLENLPGAVRTPSVCASACSTASTAAPPLCSLRPYCALPIDYASSPACDAVPAPAALARLRRRPSAPCGRTARCRRAARPAPPAMRWSRSGWNTCRERVQRAVGIPARHGWKLDYPQRAVGIPAGSGWNTCRERLEHPPGAVGIAGSGWSTRQGRLEYPPGAVGMPAGSGCNTRRERMEWDKELLRMS